MAIEDFAYTLELDTARDGTWATEEKFIQATIRHGRGDALSRIPPSEMTLLLNNADGRWSPLNTDIANLDHDIPIRLYSTWTEVAVTNIDENPAGTIDQSAFSGGWIATGLNTVIVRDTVERWCSLASAKVSIVTAGSGRGIDKRKTGFTRFTVGPNLAHTWRVQVKGPGAKSMRVSIDWFDSSSVFISRESKTVTLSADWQPFTVQGTSPGTAAFASLVVLTDGDQGIFDFFLDASFFYQSATLLPYVDGRQAGCTWSSTADASTSSRSANPKFLLFQGFIYDFELSQEGKSHRATIICRDRLSMILQERVSMGLILRKPSGLVLHRLLDRIEGELITTWGFEDADVGSPGDLTGWTAIGSGPIVLNEVGASPPDAFEQDWVLVVRVAGANEGARYDATSDITATGDYEAAVYARCIIASQTVQVKFRYLRDSTEVAIKVVTLDNNWQRIPLPFNTGALGTNRYFEVLTNVSDSDDFALDDLHCVKKIDAFARSIDAGRSTLEMAGLFDEAAGRLLNEILATERGGAQFFVEAKTLSDGDRVIFHDGNSRPASPTPRLVLGDGDGLLAFASSGGLKLRFDAADRVSSVIVTSRGSFTIGDKNVGVWSLAPERNIAVDDEFLARFSQAILSVDLVEKVGGLNSKQRSFGLGYEMLVDSAGTPGFLGVQGRPLDFPFGAESRIEKRDTALQFNRNLPISMPLQATASSDMDDEADDLLTRYKAKVVRLDVGLSMQQPPAGDADVIQAFQMDLGIDEAIVIEAKHESHSPNLTKTLWIEGIEHRISGNKINTTLHVEEV